MYMLMSDCYELDTEFVKADTRNNKSQGLDKQVMSW